MNPAQLLSHFDRISDAPDAVPRLRQFILELAERGKLVEQDPRDEPASELLKRVQNAKAHLTNKKKSTPEVDCAGFPLELPTGWELVPLIALGKWAIGSGFPKNEQGNQSGPFFFLKVSDMNLPGNERYITTSQNFIDQQAATRMGARIHPVGTIIFPKIGGAIATNKRRILTRGSAIDNNCLGLTFWPELSVDWCYMLLTTIDFTKYQAGTAVPALQQGVLEQILVGLPPLAEQQRIVAKVEELMALCDRLEVAQAERESRRDQLAASSLNRLNNGPDADAFREHARFYFNYLPRLTTKPQHILQLRQTILNLAVRGKLVPQDSNDEPASELLKRLQAEKARLVKEREIEKDKLLPSISESSVPFDLPDSWLWVRLGALSQLITSGSRDWAKFYSAEGAIFVRMGNLSRGSYRLKWSNIQRVKPPVHSEGARTKLEEGDILISITGEVGLLGLVPPGFGDAYINQHTCLVRPMRSLRNRYLPELFRSPFAQRQFSEPQRGIKNSFRLTDVTQLMVSLPPLAEQHRIVAKVDELMAICDRLEAQLTTTQTESRRLLEAVLHEALTGREEHELVNR